MKTKKRILLALLYSVLVFFFCSGSTSCTTNYSDPANAIDYSSHYNCQIMTEYFSKEFGELMSRFVTSQ